MRNRYLAILTAMACVFSALGQAHVNPVTRALMFADKNAQQKSQNSQKAHSPYANTDNSKATICNDDESDEPEQAPAPYRPLILQIDNDQTIESLIELGVIVYHQRGQLLLTSIPREALGDVLDLEGVLHASSCGSLCTTLDVARPFGRVDLAQQGQDLPMGYDGDGIVAGFSDIGFDATHIAFADRIGYISDYDTQQGIVRKAITPDEIAQWVTDTDENYHATHVANILTGGYMGNPYYGVAPKAEIAATTSQLHDVGILSGVEDIIAYGKQQGKPVVINLSLSSYIGPHDGTDLLCQYLSGCAEDAVICISAGNNGKTNAYAGQNLSQGEAQIGINSRIDGGCFTVDGMTDIWSDTDQPFELSIGVYNTDAKEIVYQTPWMTGEFEGMIDAESDPEWAQYMDGYLYFGAELCTLNNRYNASVLYSTTTEAQSERGAWSLYRTCVCVRAIEGYDPDVHIDMFTEGSSSIFGNMSNSITKASSQASINDMCTAKGVISVGMATSRNITPLVDGDTQEWGWTVDNISQYSSYNITPYIERLPHVAGPGAYVVSAMSTPYALAHPDVMMAAESLVNDQDYYWYTACGTSMSAPFVAGVAALFLQADPTLTSTEILEIMLQTARTDFDDIDDPRWGAGCIDACAGLKRVIEQLSLTGIHSDESFDNTIYTLQGIPVINPTRPGIYIKANKKFIVR